MNWIFAAYCIVCGIILLRLAWTFGFNAGYEECQQNHRWHRWLLRREQNRSTRI